MQKNGKENKVIPVLFFAQSRQKGYHHKSKEENLHLNGELQKKTRIELDIEENRTKPKENMHGQKLENGWS